MAPAAEWGSIRENVPGGFLFVDDVAAVGPCRDRHKHN